METNIDAKLVHIAKRLSTINLQRLDATSRRELYRIVNKLENFVDRKGGAITLVDQFVKEEVIASPGDLTTFEELRARYHVWRKSRTNVSKIDSALFKAILDGYGWQKTGSKSRPTYIGIKLKPNVIAVIQQPLEPNPSYTITANGEMLAQTNYI